MQTAPNAELYVANVVRPGKTGQKAKHVAAAIAWAIENEVDIISMSFGWGNEQEEVDKQIDLARCKGILLFAAASNDGDLCTESYPASKHTVYGVCSCSGFGNISTFNPRSSKPEKSFMFPGEDITILGANHKPTKGVIQTGEGGVERRTGTSYATPIAAGTAAMLLDLARQELINPQALRDVERRLKKVEGMSAVLLAMSGEPRYGGYYRVRPWTLLGKSEPIPAKHNVGETHKRHALMNVLQHLRSFGPYAEVLS
jgi:subtilisin family serine protease